MKFFIMKIGIAILNIIYFFIKFFPTKNKITMISRQSDNKTIDFALLEKEINLRKDNYKVVILCHKLDGGVASSIKNKVKYLFHMFRQMYHIATSRVVILDSYCIAISILRHKRKLNIIQMWHSMGTMKKFGYSVLGLSEGSNVKLALTMKMHKNYSYIFASGEAYKEHLSSGFNADINKILIYPLPRYDLLKDNIVQEKYKNKIINKYPVLNNKKNILYCPTFRKKDNNTSKAINDLISCVNTKKYNLIIKLHPLSNVKLNIDKKGIIVDNDFSTLEMLSISDYVISDYSCIIYEAAVKGIPIYFYNYDMDTYVDSRGLAIDYYKELPGKISSNPEIIINSIEIEKYDYLKLKKFSDKYVRPTKNATKDIVDFIFNIINKNR